MISIIFVNKRFVFLLSIFFHLNKKINERFVVGYRKKSNHSIEKKIETLTSLIRSNIGPNNNKYINKQKQKV